MTELDRAAEAAGFLLPDHAGRSLGQVLPAVADALGLRLDDVVAPDGGPGAPVPDGSRARGLLGLPSADRVCVVLVDGLGLQMLTERAGHAPFLRRQLPDAVALRVGYPSTTAASIGLFGTGCAAGRTGLAGYTVRNPATGELANLVSWTGVEPAAQWRREPPLLGRIAARVEVASVGPARFAGSGLTVTALDGGTYVAAESLAARVDATVQRLARPGLVYLYWGDVDKVGHHLGWRSAEWGDALAEVDFELGRLARALPAGTLMVVTADHGMVDVDRTQLIDVARTPALAADVELVAGEPRASHVHLVPGADADAVAARWRDTLAGRAVVATRADAVAAGWFGPVTDAVRPVLGDLVVAATGVAGVVDSRTQTPRSLELIGMHGSLTPGEMLVPLLVVA